MNFRIEKPCTEDWTKMTATQAGAFCQQCALEVVDFTDKTPLEIKQILASKISSDSRVCGRVRNDQLAKLNGDFIAWKNAREEVNAIWVFSLIAVFGFSLFSCSDRPTREILEQISISSNELIAQDSSATSEEIVGLEIPEVEEISAPETDTLSNRVGPYQPWMNITMGGISLHRVTFEPNWECLVTVGSITSGFVTIDPAQPEFLELFLKALPNSNAPIAFGKHQLFSPSQQQTQTNSNQATLDSQKDFKVEIAPLPIDKNSKLHLKVFRNTDIHITIKETLSKTSVLDFKGSYLPGKYTLSAELYLLPIGEYVVFVHSNQQQEKIEFGCWLKRENTETIQIPQIFRHSDWSSIKK